MELMTKTVTAVQNATPDAMQRDNWFGNNKTKFLGLAIATVGYLQLPANTAVIQNMVGETAMPVVTMVLGLVALWFGMLNSPEATKE